MKDVNAHICPTCGGILSVNIERQMYECPFCGVTFDYDYFREESVLGIAARALENNEFYSADRAYNFMLEKEPDNFEALRGKALIAMNIPKIDDIRSLDLFSKINYESAYKEIDRGIESSGPKEREYFTVMKDIVDAGHEYVDEKSGLEPERNERKRILKRLNEYVEERNTVGIYSPAGGRLKKSVIRTIFCYLICLLIVFLGYKLATRNPYSKAEDLSQYEKALTQDSSDQSSHLYNPYGTSPNLNDITDWYINYEKYEEALEREEQRKINYDNWEKNHQNSAAYLIWPLGFTTVIFALIVFAIFMWGRVLDTEIAKIQVEADEQEEKIRNREDRMAELKDRIDQGYKRLCIMNPKESPKT
ncbi:MAG: hypothetical protein J5509_01615 [Lachnospiraceae bacterium]|nr:hypothetical protein [Lachnospiraceae bacterium]